MENEEKIDIVEISEILDKDGNPIKESESTYNKKKKFKNNKIYIHFSNENSLLSKILLGLMLIVVMLLIFWWVVFIVPIMILLTVILKIGKSILKTFKK